MTDCLDSHSKRLVISRVNSLHVLVPRETQQERSYQCESICSTFPLEQDTLSSDDDLPHNLNTCCLNVHVQWEWLGCSSYFTGFVEFLLLSMFLHTMNDFCPIPLATHLFELPLCVFMCEGKLTGLL